METTEDPTEDIEIQEETSEIPGDPLPLVRQTNSAPEPEPEPEPEPPPKKKVPKKYEKADCKKCGKTMSLNTLRYKHKCGEVEEEPPPPPARKAKAKPKKTVVVEEEEEESEPPTPRSNLRNMYQQVRLQQLDAKRNRYRGFFD